MDVATETLNASAFILLLQKAMILGVPSSLAVGLNSLYNIFSWARILSGKRSKSVPSSYSRDKLSDRDLKLTHQLFRTLGSLCPNVILDNYSDT